MLLRVQLTTKKFEGQALPALAPLNLPLLTVSSAVYSVNKTLACEVFFDRSWRGSYIIIQVFLFVLSYW